MIARQVPNDAHRPQMVGLSQMKNLLDDLPRRSVLWVLGDRPFPDKTCLPMILKRRLPAVEAGSADAEVTTGPADMPDLLGMPQDPQPPLDLAIFLGRRRHPPGPTGP